MTPEQIARLAALRALTTLTPDEDAERDELEALAATDPEIPADGGDPAPADAPAPVEPAPADDPAPVAPEPGTDPVAPGDPDPAPVAPSPAPGVESAELSRLREEVAGLRAAATEAELARFSAAGVIVPANRDAATALLSHDSEDVRRAAGTILGSMTARVALGRPLGTTTPTSGSSAAGEGDRARHGRGRGRGPVARPHARGARSSDRVSATHGRQTAPRSDRTTPAPLPRKARPMTRKISDYADAAAAFLAARAGWSGGMTMAVTRPVDVPDWNPAFVEAAFYDRLDDPALTLTNLAARFNEMTGMAGDTVRIATDAATTPAANLAVDVPAVDDSLSSASFTFTVKEAVKSIAWYDRTQVQSSQNVNDLAGRKVGRAVEERIELDLGSAAVAGRATAKDGVAAALTLDVILAMKSAIPQRLRRGGVAIVAADAQMIGLYSDPVVRNAATFGSDEVLRTGQFTRPIMGVTPFVTDDGVLPNATISGTSGPLVLAVASGMLGYGFQRDPRAEQERDARARLTRWVGTAFHGEAVLESAGIVARRIGA